MTKRALLLTLGLFCLGVSFAFAGPYFRPLDLKHPQVSVGALIDQESPSDTAAVTKLAIFTHSPVDGCLFPALACVAWSPLAVGGSVAQGRAALNAGPSVNLAPLTRALLLAGLERFTAGEKYLGLKTRLDVAESESDLGLAFGPDLGWNLAEGGQFLAPGRWRGQFRWFVGGAWKY